MLYKKIIYTLWQWQVHCDSATYTVTVPRTLWQFQVHCDSSRYTVTVTDTLWQWQVHYDSERYTVTVTGTLWQSLVQCDSDRYTVTVTGTLWQWQVHCDSVRYTVAVSGTLWQCQIHYNSVVYIVKEPFTQWECQVHSESVRYTLTVRQSRYQRWQCGGLSMRQGQWHSLCCRCLHDMTQRQQHQHNPDELTNPWTDWALLLLSSYSCVHIKLLVRDGLISAQLLSNIKISSSAIFNYFLFLIICARVPYIRC